MTEINESELSNYSLINTSFFYPDMIFKIYCNHENKNLSVTFINADYDYGIVMKSFIGYTISSFSHIGNRCYKLTFKDGDGILIDADQILISEE